MDESSLIRDIKTCDIGIFIQSLQTTYKNQCMTLFLSLINPCKGSVDSIYNQKTVLQHAICAFVDESIVLDMIQMSQVVNTKSESGLTALDYVISKPYSMKVVDALLAKDAVYTTCNPPRWLHRRERAYLQERMHRYEHTNVQAIFNYL